MQTHRTVPHACVTFDPAMAMEVCPTLEAAHGVSGGDAWWIGVARWYYVDQATKGDATIVSNVSGGEHLGGHHKR